MDVSTKTNIYVQLIIGSAVVLVMGAIFLITYYTSQKAKRDHKKSIEYRGGKLDINVMS